jgi:hypothetical protein
MAGLKTTKKKRNGKETAITVRADFCIANDFGASSPNTICNTVITTNDKIRGWL